MLCPVPNTRTADTSSHFRKGKRKITVWGSWCIILKNISGKDFTRIFKMQQIALYLQYDRKINALHELGTARERGECRDQKELDEIRNGSNHKTELSIENSKEQN